MAFSAIVRGGQEQLMFHSLAYEFLKNSLYWMDVTWCLKVFNTFLTGSWRNSRRSGLKIRSQEIDVWVQLPPVPLLQLFGFI